MTEKIQHRTASGKAIAAALAKPAAQRAPGLIIIHEWWGLNKDMENIADAYAKEGYLSLAVDLFEGKVTDSRERAQQLMAGIDAQHAAEALASWISWLRSHENCTGKVGTLGYCLGGAWSLNASMANPVDATVIYYGSVDKKAAELRSLKGPVLGHFGMKDTAITPASAKAFEAEMRAAGKPADIHFYDADHAFSRTKGQNYHKPSADLALSRTLEFLKKNLAG